MNEIEYKFLLPGDKFMDEMNLRQFGFTCTVCRTFTKIKENIKKQRNIRLNIYLSNLTKQSLLSA